MTITQDVSAPLVAVVGATGNQGGSVIKALAESSRPYRVRAFTRDATKPAAQALVKIGVEVVVISLVVDNVQHVRKAFEGANMAFLVTNFWEHFDVNREIEEGKMLIDAATAAGAERIVWSGLVDVSKASGGKYVHTYHSDGKAAVTEHARNSGASFVDVQAGFYATNFLNNPSMLSKQPDGSFTIVMPVKPTTIIPVIDIARDYGLFVRQVLELPVFPRGSEVLTSSENITIEDLARQLSEVTGKNVQFQQITIEEFAKSYSTLGFPPKMILDMVDGFQYAEEFGFFAGKATASLEGLGRRPHTWTEFSRHADWSKTLV
ncbi:NAD(P)-binding protein [Mycena rebaudengoi]|nr:NAD(P)-binding protein [Mycena rebaudengoi]